MDSWIVDPGATCHMCNDKKQFVEFKSLESSQEVTLGDGYSVEATGRGVVRLKMTLSDALVVAGSKFEAIDGQNVTISFDIDEVEKADEVKIIFKEDKKEYDVLFAQKPWVYDDPPRPGVTLIVGKGCLSVIIQNVDISRSGLYKAEAYTGKKVCEVTATLVVNKAPVSSSPTPLSSSDLHWLYALIPLVIVVSGVVGKRGTQRMMKKKPEKLLLSPDPVSPQKTIIGKTTAVVV
ncbi:unnamed protein product [Leuciscus chuanchicus]